MRKSEIRSSVQRFKVRHPLSRSPKATEDHRPAALVSAGAFPWVEAVATLQHIQE